MSTFTMKLDLGNAAFHDDDGDFDPGPELASILRRASVQVAEGFAEGRCYDINGNKVGSWEIEQ